MEPNLTRKLLAFGVIGLMGATCGITVGYYEHLDHAPATFTIGTPVIHHIAPLALDPDRIEAKAAILYDPVTGDVLFEKNAQAQLPLASLTKLATARAVLSSANHNQIVVISAEDLKPEGDSGFSVGDVWRLGDLIAYGLTTSSNDAMAAAAAALSPGVAVERMNEEAKKSDMSQSYFLNETGLDISPSTAGAYGSAFDVARLVEDLLRDYPNVFEATVHTPRVAPPTNEHEVDPTTAPIWDLPGLIAAKTGYTDLAGGNLAVADDLGIGQPVIAVVLGSSIDGRFNDVRTMLAALRKQLAE